MSKLKIIAPIITSCLAIGGISGIASCSSSSIKIDKIDFDVPTVGSVTIEEAINFTKNQMYNFEIDLSILKVWKPEDGEFHASMFFTDKNFTYAPFKLTGIRIQIGKTELEPKFSFEDLSKGDATYCVNYDLDGFCYSIDVYLNRTFNINDKIFVSFLVLNDLENIFSVFTATN